MAQGYINPIIPGFNPDPSITRKGGDYYLATSSFEYFPGVPIYHSKDLVHWERISYALPTYDHLPLDSAQSSMGIYAPTLRYDERTDLFYMITTNVYKWNRGGYNFYVTAKNPRGPWSKPIKIKLLEDDPMHDTWPHPHGDDWWYDPDLFFDEDGKVYYSRQNGVATGGGENGHIVLAEIDIETGVLKEHLTKVWDRYIGIWPEGDHIYKKDGWYYMLRAEGGTGANHMLTIARSKDVHGPYEPGGNNPILTQNRDAAADRMIQDAGHGDFVLTQNGEWWLVYLGTRKVGLDPRHGKDFLGRETFLSPVDWPEGEWPVINGGDPQEVEMPKKPDLPEYIGYQTPMIDNFKYPEFENSWNFLRNPDSSNYSLSDRQGWLRLTGSAQSLDEKFGSPTYLCRRFEGFNKLIQTRMEFDPKTENEEAGLAIRMNEHYFLKFTIRLDNGKRSIVNERVIYYNNDNSTHSVPVDTDGPVILSIATDTLYALLEAFDDEGKLIFGPDSVPLTDRLSSNIGGTLPEVGHMFTGLYVGPYASGNGSASGSDAYFDWFLYKDEMPFNIDTTITVPNDSVPPVSSSQVELSSSENMESSADELSSASESSSAGEITPVQNFLKNHVICEAMACDVQVFDFSGRFVKSLRLSQGESYMQKLGFVPLGAHYFLTPGGSGKMLISNFK